MRVSKLYILLVLEILKAISVVSTLCSLCSGTNQQIVVVVGGEYIFNSNDTEMLIDGRWQRGQSMPTSLSEMSMVHFDGDLYVIGKRDFWLKISLLGGTQIPHGRGHIDP